MKKLLIILLLLCGCATRNYLVEEPKKDIISYSHDYYEIPIVYNEEDMYIPRFLEGDSIPEWYCGRLWGHRAKYCYIWGLKPYVRKSNNHKDSIFYKPLREYPKASIITSFNIKTYNVLPNPYTRFSGHMPKYIRGSRIMIKSPHD